MTDPVEKLFHWKIFVKKRILNTNPENSRSINTIKFTDQQTKMVVNQPTATAPVLKRPSNEPPKRPWVKTTSKPPCGVR